MNRRQWLAGGALLTLAAGTRAFGKPALPPPQMPKQPLCIEQLGRIRCDDYAWIKPDNWKAVWRDPAVLDTRIRQWLETERIYADAVLAQNRALEDSLFRQMRAHSAPLAPVPPAPDGDWHYGVRIDTATGQPIHFRRKRGEPEEILLDGTERARGKAFLHIGRCDHSADHRLFAWAEDETGAEKFRILIRDLETGKLIEGPADAFGSFVFSPDSRWLFWTWRDVSSRPARIYRRSLADGTDSVVHDEADPGFLMEVRLTDSRDWILIRCWHDVTSEVRVIPGSDPAAGPRVIEPRTPGLFYDVEHVGDDFVIRTNADGAVDFKLVRAPVTAPGRAGWRPFVQHRPGRLITDVHGFADHVLRVERVEGNPELIVRPLDGESDRTIAFGEAAWTVSLANADHARGQIDIAMSSPRMPPFWERLDVASGVRTRLSRANGLRERYTLQRLHATAEDGALVPITLMGRRGKRGPAPLLLTGYGSYGYSYETGFDPAALALVDQGWCWAVAHVRGGSEKGRDWFEQARTLHKKRSFEDFIACARHLIAHGVTQRGRIAIHGHSAGGLLVGAAANMAPELWSCVIGQAPFVDMLNTMSDDTHPLVPLTRPVWGDPLGDPVAYDYIASYSPYENVASRAYPPVLATTAIGDDRVGFWEPAKWIAKLREHSTSGNPMLLHVETSGGHGGGDRLADLRLLAKAYAFAISADRCGGGTGSAGRRRIDGTSR